MHKPPETSFAKAASRLSMLALSTEEELPMEGSLEGLVALTGELDELKCEAVPCQAPSAEPCCAALREDEISESLPLHLALKNAKSTYGGFITVPKAFE